MKRTEVLKWVMATAMISWIVAVTAAVVMTEAGRAFFAALGTLFALWWGVNICNGIRWCDRCGKKLVLRRLYCDPCAHTALNAVREATEAWKEGSNAED